MGLSAFTIPVFLDTNVDAGQILQQWMRLYYYGHTYMPALCIATCGLYGYAALSRRVSSHKQWYRYALAAVLTISMVPFTWLVMVSTNDTLFLLGASDSGTELNLARALVVKWAWLHVMRSLSPLFGAILGFVSILHEL